LTLRPRMRIMKDRTDTGEHGAFTTLAPHPQYERLVIQRGRKCPSPWGEKES